MSSIIESGEVRDYDTLHAIRDEFQAKAKSGTATRQDLLDFVLTIDDVGNEVIPTSEGMGWIHRHPQDFLRIVGDVDSFMEETLALVDSEEGFSSLGYWFFEGFIVSEQLMSLLSPAWRKRYITEVYPRFGAHNHSWINAAILTGVPRQIIADAILDRLQKVEVKPGMANDVDDFLQYGAERGEEGNPVILALRSLGLTDFTDIRGEIEKDPSCGFFEIEDRLHLGRRPIESRFGGFPIFRSWSVLSNQELVEALSICAIKSPGKTIQTLDKQAIKKRLDSGVIGAILITAIHYCTSLSAVSLEVLNRLSLEERKILASKLKVVEDHWLQKPTAQFLFKLIVDLPPEQRATFWEKVIKPVLEKTGASTLYCAWRQLGLVEKNVEITLRRWLDNEGYAVDKIRKGQHPKGGIQWVVQRGDVKYVRDGDQHRYFPTDGEEVIFRLKGTRLTPSVIAVYFTPVMKDLRD